ncbi:MAG: hypothetical protein DRN28_06505 [Thermoplasmata archaeon]|nr:MAG: hypothetical protein DRN28_06505 [Thermoplasmata archaeon]
MLVFYPHSGAPAPRGKKRNHPDVSEPPPGRKKNPPQFHSTPGAPWPPGGDKKILMSQNHPGALRSSG